MLPYDKDAYLRWIKQNISKIYDVKNVPVAVNQVEQNHWIQDIGREHEKEVYLSALEDDDEASVTPEWLRNMFEEDEEEEE